ncbi:MAG: Rab family GTPase [Candidatus Odinarchaeota archaeon]
MVDEDNNLRIFKIVLAGAAGTGKTCLINRFVDGVFSYNTKSTIGVDFSLKNMTVKDPRTGVDERIALQLWDMAGEERFRYVLPYYIVGTEGILYVFDITNPGSLAALDEWLEVTRSHLRENIPMVLLAAKNDLEPVVTAREVQEFLERNGIDCYFKTSSLKDENVNEAFIKLTYLIIDYYARKEQK